MASDQSTRTPSRLQLPDPRPCPLCGGERIVYDDPHNVCPVLVCVECTPWVPTDEFPGVEAAVRLAMIRRAI